MQFVGLHQTVETREDVIAVEGFDCAAMAFDAVANGFENKLKEGLNRNVVAAHCCWIRRNIVTIFIIMRKEIRIDV